MMKKGVSESEIEHSVPEMQTPYVPSDALGDRVPRELGLGEVDRDDVAQPLQVRREAPLAGSDVQN